MESSPRFLFTLKKVVYTQLPANTPTHRSPFCSMALVLTLELQWLLPVRHHRIPQF